jgi:hypothetical protein
MLGALVDVRNYGSIFGKQDYAVVAERNEVGVSLGFY